MRYFLLLPLLFITLKSYGQTNNDYLVVIKGDTFTIALTDMELIDAKKSRVAELRHLTKHRKKKILEKAACELKLNNNDTVFWAGIVDYYDDYFIALTGTLQKKSKKVVTMTPLRFRRIKFSEIEWIETDGKRNIGPQLILGTVLLCIGPPLTILAIKDDFKDEEDPFSPAFIPVGLGISYLGVRLWNDILTKTYYLKEWEVKMKEVK
jgi:hypothetical protein